MKPLPAWLRALWCSLVGHEAPLHPTVRTIVTGRTRVVGRIKRCVRCGEVLR